MYVFLFKQKTAYEMRISDWSSDVCSSDLHVIADAACDADPLRAFIVDDLGANAQIKANPGRAIAPPIDWRLYKERHQVECFFNKLKRFRRIALSCEKTKIGKAHVCTQVTNPSTVRLLMLEKKNKTHKYK